MNKFLKIAGITVLLMVSFYSLWALDKFQTLDEITVEDNSISIALSGPVKYHAFKISNPPRVVVEFTNTEFNAKDKEITGSGDIKRIRGGQFQNEPVKIARVVVDMVKMDKYKIRRNGNSLKLTFLQPNVDKEKTDGEVVASTATPTLTSSSTSISTSTVSAQEQSTEAKPEVSPNVPAPEIAVAAPAAAPTLVATPTPAPAPKAEAVPKDKATIDETPITIAEPVSPKEALNVAIPTPKPLAPQVVENQKKSAAVNSPKPATKNNYASKQLSLPKKPITIDFEEADIRDVFRMLSMKSGMNIIYGNDVTGTITLRLENVPFDKAFETILSLKNLVSEEDGPNILRIATPQQISEERAQGVAFTKIFPLNYAKAADVKSNLDSVRNAEGRKGSISVDERTNSLIITDTPEGLVSFEKLLKELDVKPLQVIIEAKIVEVDLTKDFDLGIQWQYANTFGSLPNNQVTIGGTQIGANGAVTPVSVVGGGTSGTTGPSGTGVAFPATPSAAGEIGQIAFGIVSNQMNITGTLSALAQKGLSKLLSDPKVTTVNNKEARILVGQKIPYTTTTVTTTGSTQSTNFLDVGVKLTVTPTINIDHKITLVVHPEVSLYVRADPAGPVVGTREASTTVIVNDGETVVIGGLITDQDIKQGESVPLLGDIPIIGQLFKHTYNSKERTELLVFLTPQLLNN